jgi:hypothetical protein
MGVAAISDRSAIDSGQPRSMGIKISTLDSSESLLTHDRRLATHIRQSALAAKVAPHLTETARLRPDLCRMRITYS